MALPKAELKLDKNGVSGALFNDTWKALECSLLDLFNAKLYTHSLDLHIQRIGNAYLRRMHTYKDVFRAVSISMIGLLVTTVTADSK